MDSSLSQFLEGVIEWMRAYNEAKIPWSEPHISVIHSYVLKLDLNFDSGFLIGYASFCNRDLWHRRLEQESYKTFTKMIMFFIQDIQDIFVVPCNHKESAGSLTKNELVAAFISFLLQLLYHKTDLVVSFEDQINDIQSELSFLITVLGDISISFGDGLEQVQNLLVEFETVANEAGSVVYFLTFSVDGVFKARRMAKALGALVGQIDLLKANIIKFLNIIPFFAETNMTKKTAAIDSVFIVDSLLYDLEDLINLEDGLTGDIMDQIKILYEGLMCSWSFLNVIRRQSYSEIEELKEPVMQIRNAAYEAEYLINSYLVGDCPLWYLTIRLTQVIHNAEVIGTEIEKIKKIHEVGTLKVAEPLSNLHLSLQDNRYSEMDEIVVGFEDEETNILDQLVGGTKHLQIITLFGMAGIGKTTLAKKLYNCPLVNYRFDKRVWGVASQIYKRKRLLIDILIGLASELDKDKISDMEEESLIERIYKSLKGRRYLIVMDDIWSSDTWDDLRRFLPDDVNGSRVLFTSRLKDVTPPGNILHALPFLSSDQSWELLKKRVFQNKLWPPELLQVGKEIALCCGGLPLAVVVVAGILSTKENEENNWINVVKSLPSYIPGERDGLMMPILDLSYKNLPDHLKPCFLYFGAFQEDTTIPARELLRLWVAEGFICKEEKEIRESVAEEYLMELIDKSLVMIAQKRSDGGVKTCVIHDVLFDFCMKRAAEENLLKKVVDNDCTIYEKGRRLLSVQGSLTAFGPHVRSFHGYRGELQLPIYAFSMKLLRVLNFQPPLCHFNLIGTEYLVNLRYIVINDFPVSVGSLVNLEYLRVGKSKSNHIFAEVLTIPLVILRMVKLRYLHVIPRAKYEEECSNCSINNNIECLSNFLISSVKDEEMLNCTPDLRKLKCYCPKPLCVEENGTSEYRYPDLSFLTQLETLKLTTHHRILIGVKIAEMNFPSNIRKLTINCLRLPWEETWKIGRLSNLEILKLGSSAFVGKRWDTRDGEFQKLKFLKLHGPSFLPLEYIE